MSPELSPGFAVLCDLQGSIVRVLLDDLALGERIGPGQTLTRLVDRGSLSKALSFLVQVRTLGAAFDWELNVPAGSTIGRPAQTLHFTAGALPDGLLIVGAATGQRALQLYAELLRVANGQAHERQLAEQERFDAQNAPAEVAHTLFDDISRLNNDLVNLQRELAQANAQLEQRVAARTADLAQANAALTRALRARSDFMAAVSHELRTPLTGVLGLAETLELGIYGPLTERQEKPVQMIHANGERLLRLVNDVLDYTALEAGTVALHLADVSVAEVCQASLQAVRSAADSRHIHLTCQIAPAADTVLSDRQRLQQMLAKLLENAIKFTPEGGAAGLDVTGATAAGETGQEMHFTVWDTGIGIAPEDRVRVFDAFTQADSRLARSYEGAGLGLALVRRLAELHGGRVSAESAGPGQGSRFTVSLPWRTPPSAL